MRMRMDDWWKDRPSGECSTGLASCPPSSIGLVCGWQWCWEDERDATTFPSSSPSPKLWHPLTFYDIFWAAADTGRMVGWEMLLPSSPWQWHLLTSGDSSYKSIDLNVNWLMVVSMYKAYPYPYPPPFSHLRYLSDNLLSGVHWHQGPPMYNRQVFARKTAAQQTTV